MNEMHPIINDLARLDGTVYKSTGACRYCDADEKLTIESANVARITIMHDNECPILAEKSET